MSDHTITRAGTELVAFMAEVHPVNAGDLRYYILGRDADDENNLIVVDSKSGGAWNYCKAHRFVYRNKGHCGPCWDLVAEPVADTQKGKGVAPRNTLN